MEMSLREEELSGTIQSVNLKNLFLSVVFFWFLNQHSFDSQKREKGCLVDKCLGGFGD